MDNFCVTFYVLMLLSQSLYVTACPHKYIQKPLFGYHCVTRLDSMVTAQQTDRPQCVWKCLILETCHNINHNHVTRQCDLGLSKCESLIPVDGGVVNVFGPPRDTCVHWGSSQEPGRVPVEIPGQVRLARIKIGDALLVGKFTINNEKFWANNEGIQVGPVYETDQDIEFLTVDPACTLPWMPYRAGGLIPADVIGGGHLSDGSTTYVVKVLHNDAQTFGYYNARSELVYYDYRGANTKNSMEVLVLLWQYIRRPRTWPWTSCKRRRPYRILLHGIITDYTLPSATFHISVGRPWAMLGREYSALQNLTRTDIS